MATGVGIIGLGMAVTPHMLALRDLEAAGRARIIGGYAPSAARRDGFAARWSASAFDSLDGLLAAPGLDLALILAPPGEHLPIAECVAAAGKHMIVEKPLERTVARAEALAAVAERSGVRASVCFQHRFRPAALELARRLRTGDLGRPLSASASIRWWRDANYFAQPGRGTMARDGGGVLLTQAIHTMDLLLHLMGPVRDVTGFAQNAGLRVNDTEDVAAAAIRFENGALGVIDATSVARPGFPERIEIAGTKASALLIGNRLEWYAGDGPPEILDPGSGTGGGADPMAFDHGPHRALITEMLDAIAENRAPSNDARSALHVQRLIESWLGGRP
ncbi:Gfo/Idh/MocA family protein [Neoroseomonas oryzicola]|uniref:Gfo/Idh/MocA family oxidoreductase n=1 Tax=Neoroseomonas oryzicola TaxID=535904 RepID=A0A9X9WC93_9PROT|nr:Gfo/Idh/MocA family oxidoreductase [Neoroseomonas oryzicola]MBR0657953.1 Gfo/Idh/MocA family oxidoreductase [Neoroseomonas oryzicola]NKE18729.1 Gfo/Idh/MocA family oxidoreductase [Neoroseomonas oryzicola]